MRNFSRTLRSSVMPPKMGLGSCCTLDSKENHLSFAKIPSICDFNRIECCLPEANYDSYLP